jgi:hypothetical protein
MCCFIAVCCVALVGRALADEPAGEGTEVNLDGLKSTTPGNWKKEKTISKLRVYQFKLPKADGDKADADLAVFYFGPGSGGSEKENIKRWQGMFRPPEGKKIEDATNVDKMKVGKVDVTYVDVQGTYLDKFPPFDPNAKVTPRPDYRRLGVIFQSENGPYFITLTGPARTIAQNKKAFDGWLKAFK